MFTSCATLFTKGGFEYRDAEKNYKKGHYVTAIDKVLIALEKNPEFPEALELFPRAFNHGTDAYLSKTTEKSLANAGNAYEAWKDLQEMNKLVLRSGRTEVEVTDYSEEIKIAKEYYLEVNYYKAMELLSSWVREDAILSLQYFKKITNMEPDYIDVKERVQEAIEIATVDIAIDTGIIGVNPYAELYHSVLTKELSAEPFIRLHPIKEFSRVGVQPAILMDQAIRDGIIDYVITMTSEVNTDLVRNTEDWPITEESEISPDGRKSRIGYNVNSSLNYGIYGSGFSEIDSGQIVESFSDGIWLYKIMGRLYKDTDLGDGSGKKNIIVAEMYNDERKPFTNEEVNQALHQVSKKTLSFTMPAEMERFPYDHIRWKKYFIENYDFKSLSKEFDNAWFSDAKALFQHNQTSFWLIFSGDPKENDHLTKVSSSMFQGVFGAALQFTEDEVKSEESYHVILAKKLAEKIKDKF